MSYNGQQLFTKLADGTFDFSKQHEQFYMINGAAGRGLTPFSQDPKTNTNVMFANDEDLGYSVFSFMFFTILTGILTAMQYLRYIL